MRRGRIGRVTRHSALGECQGRAHAQSLKQPSAAALIEINSAHERTEPTLAHDKLASWLGNPCRTGLTTALRSCAGIKLRRRSPLFSVNESRLSPNPRGDPLRGVRRARHSIDRTPIDRTREVAPRSHLFSVNESRRLSNLPTDRLRRVNRSLYRLTPRTFSTASITVDFRLTSQYSITFLPWSRNSWVSRMVLLRLPL
jgi:hypothetical protein